VGFLFLGPDISATATGSEQQNAATHNRSDHGSIHDRLYAQIFHPPERLAMIISMKMHATRQEIDEVRAQVAYFGYKVHSIEGEERVVIGVVGVGDVTACLESVESMPQVEKVVRISAPYKFVSKQFKPGRTRVALNNGVEIGGDEFIVMAGPCSVESEKQIMQAAEGVAKAGAKMLRGGAFKPRTSPYDFQGMEEDGLKLLQKAKAATGLGIVTEVMSDRDVDLIAQYADVMQVGARNMQNFMLLKALGKCGKPVLLKRGLSGTIKELLMSAEYIVAHGNPNVILCERGIRTFETETRNTCDIAAIPALNELTHLPVMLDPSHATGKRSLVPAVSRAGVAIGADGIIVEVHPSPEKAISDGAQSLDLPAFEKMMRDLAPYIALWESSRKLDAVAATA
jgi:3-deoxy-7-phosphoheptulonate synthase